MFTRFKFRRHFCHCSFGLRPPRGVTCLNSNREPIWPCLMIGPNTPTPALTSVPPRATFGVGTRGDRFPHALTEVVRIGVRVALLDGLVVPTHVGPRSVDIREAVFGRELGGGYAFLVPSSTLWVGRKGHDRASHVARRFGCREPWRSGGSSPVILAD